MADKFIVALGYSEGGIDSVKAFFSYTPHDQATYIILRHIPIEARSELHQILKQYSKLKVEEAENNTEIKKDTVYVPPAHSYLTLKNDKLVLLPRVNQRLPYNRSIDIFLESLAKEKGEKSIAVIFSGTGDDGTEGISLLKKAGGMIIAQTPESCAYSEMPKSAIETGLVDHILLPAEMPQVITKHVNPILKNENELERLKGTVR